MRRDPVDIIGGFYTDESLPWSCQDTVNYIPVRAEVAGTRTPTKLVDAPGMKPFLWIGHYAEDAVPSGPIRGMHDVEGKLFIVCGTTLYRINNKDVAIPLGAIPGTGRVSMAHNQITGGNQLIVVNGSSGYVYNTVSEVFERVVDASYPGAAIVEFIDGYLMQLEPFGRFLLFSDLADALAYNALDRFEAETAPDMTVGLAIVHQEVWALGERSIDVFENVGTAQGTFRNKGVSIQKGCGARWSTGLIDNGVAWLGNDGVIYHARSYDPVRISTRAIEVALAECSPADRRNAFAMVWEDRGHAVYYITVPNGPTFGYDFSTGLWHRRASYHPVTDVSGRWRLNDLVRANGRWVGGDYQDGRLYTLDWDYMLEGVDTPHVRERTSPAAHNNQNRFTIDHVELIFDTGNRDSDSESGRGTDPFPFPTQPKGPTISGDAPDADIGVFYSYQYTIVAGDASIASVKVSAGAAPAGMTISSDGILFGTPISDGEATYNFTVRVTDANGLYAEVADSITMDAFVSAYLPLNFGDEFVDLTGRTWTKVEASGSPSLVETPSADGSGSMLIDESLNFSNAVGLSSLWGDGAPRTGPFCIEGFFYVGSAMASGSNTNLSLLGIRNGADILDVIHQRSVDHGDTSPVIALRSAADTVRNTRQTLALQTWYHFALCRDLNSDVWLFINGKKSALPLNFPIDLDSAKEMRIGTGFSFAWSWISNIDNCRITTGWSRYSEDFTPPIAPLGYP